MTHRIEYALVDAPWGWSAFEVPFDVGVPTFPGDTPAEAVECMREDLAERLGCEPEDIELVEAAS